MSELLWAASIAGALLTLTALVRFIYRPARRVYRAANKLLDRIEQAAGGLEVINGQLLELSAAVVHYAVARDSQLSELTERLGSVAELAVDTAADLGRLTREVKELAHHA